MDNYWDFNSTPKSNFGYKKHPTKNKKDVFEDNESDQSESRYESVNITMHTDNIDQLQHESVIIEVSLHKD